MLAEELVIDTPPWAPPFFEPHRYKGIHGGRGGGKSWFFAEMMIESMVMNPDIHCVCIREVQSSIKMSVKRLLEIKIEALGVQEYFEVQEAVIKSRKGNGIIIFQGMQNHTADSIKSLEGFDICWCEESQSLSQRSLDLLRPTIRKEGSEMWFSWNPNFPTDPIDVFLRSEDPFPDSIVIEVNFDDNPWFPAVLRVEMEYDKRKDPDKYQHVWKGEYAQNSAARVFNNWVIEDFETPEDVDFDFGADWGFSVDPTVLLRMWKKGRDLYIDYEAYQLGCEIDDTPKLFMTVPDSEKWPIVADSARPETISYMKKHGFPKILKAVKGKNSIIDGIEFLKSFHTIHIHTRCKNTGDEFISYSHVIDPMTGLVTAKLKDKKNHVIDAARYGQESRRRAEKQQKQTHVHVNPTVNMWSEKRAS